MSNSHSNLKCAAALKCLSNKHILAPYYGDLFTCLLLFFCCCCCFVVVFLLLLFLLFFFFWGGGGGTYLTLGAKECVMPL